MVLTTVVPQDASWSADGAWYAVEPSAGVVDIYDGQSSRLVATIDLGTVGDATWAEPLARLAGDGRTDW